MDELNRDAIIQHLSDARVLEIAKCQLYKQISSIKNRMKNLGYHNSFRKPSFTVPILMPIVILVVSLIVSFLVAATVLKDQLFDKSYDPYFYNPIYEPDMPEIVKYIKICAVIALILCIIVTLIAFGIASSNMKGYKDMVARDNARVAQETALKNQLLYQLNTLQSKVNEAEKVLTEVYSINIIPQQFRNIYGVCYLYDYMSTSQQTLESAFLNYNINTININVNRLIEQQSQMIMQQYITNARLEGIEAHSVAMLNQLSSIESNTANAAKYSAIAATNTNTIAFVEGYDFFKNGL